MLAPCVMSSVGEATGFLGKTCVPRCQRKWQGLQTPFGHFGATLFPAGNDCCCLPYLVYFLPTSPQPMSCHGSRRTVMFCCRHQLLPLIFVVVAVIPSAGPAQTQVARAALPSLEAQLAPLAQAHKGKVALAVKHLESGESYYLNADEVMPTASLI